MLSKRTAKIQASGIRKIFELAQKIRDPFDFSLGQAHFDVPVDVKNLMIKAINEGKNRYTVTQGIQPLLEKISDKVAKATGKKPEGVIITSGATAGLFLAILSLVDEGDEVLIPDPSFMLYKHHTTLAGGRAVFIDTYPDLKVTAEKIKTLITERTKVLIINNPTNPTGVAYTGAELQAIAEVAKQHNIIILADEVYDHFVYDFPFESMLKFYDRTVMINAFSKTLGMAGWRIGYAVGPKEIIDAMITFQQVTYVCPNAPAQYAIASAMDIENIYQIKTYKQKRDMVCSMLAGVFEFVKPQGSFYIFPKTPWGTDVAFVEEAINKRVLIVPGSAFSSKNTHFRLSYAAEDFRLKKGIEILISLAKMNK